MPSVALMLLREQNACNHNPKYLLTSFEVLSQLYNELFNYLQQQHVKPGNYCAGVWHDLAYKQSDIDS
jgi:effector-binding domain-containing protein